jgi:hypothetical protein
MLTHFPAAAASSKRRHFYNFLRAQSYRFGGGGSHSIIKIESWPASRRPGQTHLLMGRNKSDDGNLNL